MVLMYTNLGTLDGNFTSTTAHIHCKGLHVHPRYLSQSFRVSPAMQVRFCTLYSLYEYRNTFVERSVQLYGSWILVRPIYCPRRLNVLGFYPNNDKVPSYTFPNSRFYKLVQLRRGYSI